MTVDDDSMRVIRSVTEDIVEQDTVVGKHVYANMYGFDDPDLLRNEGKLKEVLLEAARLANMTVADVLSITRTDGVSVVVLVIESHLAIHTWVKERYATLDIYTCGIKSDPWKAFDHIIHKLKPKFYTVNYVDRSSQPTPSPGL